MSPIAQTPTGAASGTPPDERPDGRPTPPSDLVDTNDPAGTSVSDVNATSGIVGEAGRSEETNGIGICRCWARQRTQRGPTRTGQRIDTDNPAITGVGNPDHTLLVHVDRSRCVELVDP